MEEARIHLYREMKRFGWDLEGLESAGSLGFVDATPLRLLPEKVNLGEVAIDRGDFSMMTLIQAINKEVERIKPKRIVVDPITSLIIQYPEIVQRRGAILDLVDALVSSGATCIMTSELKHTGLKRRLDVEEFLSHGVIMLQNHLINGSIVRAIQVEKMRETNCETQPRPYKISSLYIDECELPPYKRTVPSPQTPELLTPGTEWPIPSCQIRAPQKLRLLFRLGDHPQLDHRDL